MAAHGGGVPSRRWQSCGVSVSTGGVGSVSMMTGGGRAWDGASEVQMALGQQRCAGRAVPVELDGIGAAPRPGRHGGGGEADIERAEGIGDHPRAGPQDARGAGAGRAVVPGVPIAGVRPHEHLERRAAYAAGQFDALGADAVAIHHGDAEIQAIGVAEHEVAARDVERAGAHVGHRHGEGGHGLSDHRDYGAARTDGDCRPMFQSHLCHHRLQPGAGDSRPVFSDHYGRPPIRVCCEPVFKTGLRDIDICHVAHALNSCRARS